MRVALFYLAVCVGAVSACECVHRTHSEPRESVRRQNCRWQTRYMNTLQHDIHREVICDTKPITEEAP